MYQNYPYQYDVGFHQQKQTLRSGPTYFNDPTLAPGVVPPPTVDNPATQSTKPTYGGFAGWQSDKGYLNTPRPDYTPPTGAIEAGIQWGAGLPNNLFKKGWRSVLGGDGKYYWIPPNSVPDNQYTLRY